MLILMYNTKIIITKYFCTRLPIICYKAGMSKFIDNHLYIFTHMLLIRNKLSYCELTVKYHKLEHN